MNFEAFLKMLPYMGEGMLGIFAVTALMVLSIVLLNYLTGEKNDAEEGNDSSER